MTLLVMIGLGIVFGLPYLVARNRRRCCPCLTLARTLAC